MQRFGSSIQRGYVFFQRYHICPLLAYVLVAGSANAQLSSAAVSGTIVDSSGAVVQGATITLTNEATNVEQGSVTGPTGHYTVIDIQPGVYSIQVSKSDFTTIKQSHIRLSVNQALNLAFTLTVGSSQQSVTVSSNVSDVQSTTSALGTAITTKSVNDLPLNGRNFTELLTLTPGASRVDVAQNPGTQNGTSYTFPAINGQRNRSNMFLLDGMNDLAFYGNYNYQPIIDDIEEFKVQSHNDLAEFGQVTGGVVNVVTRSGTNSFHGSAWEFFRNQLLDASNYFIPTRNPLRQNVFGGTLGGPVVIPHIYQGKDKTFFFFSYEGFRKSAAAQSLELVPTAAQLGGDFSALLGQGVTLYNPFSTRPDPLHPGEYLRDQFPKNNISQYLSPAALLYAKLFPAPTVTGVAGGNLYDNTPTRNTYDSYSGRIDQSFGIHDRIYGRVSYVNQASLSSGGFPGVVSAGSLEAWNDVVHWSHVFGPTAIVDLNFGRNLGNDTSNLEFPSAPADFGTALLNAGFSSNFISNFSGVPGTIIPGFGISGYVSDTGQAIQDIQYANNYQYGGDCTKILNRHDIKLGGLFTTVAYVAPIAGADENTGAAQTSNLEQPPKTGDALASFLLGVPTSTVRRDKSQTATGGWVDSAYIQDQLTLRPNLTVNLGLRYDVAIWPTFSLSNKAKGYLGDLDLTNGTYILSAIPPACSSTVGAPCIPGGVLPANVVVTNHSNHAIHNTDTGNWQPRIGIAYQPHVTTSIRAGYNRLYDEWSGLTQDTQDIGGSWPGVGLLNINALNTNLVTATITNPLGLAPGASIQPGPTPFSASAYFYNPSLRTPYSDQWNLGIDQQFGAQTTLALAYVGSHSSRLDLGGLKNTPVRGMP